MNKYLSIGTKSFPYLKVLYDFFLKSLIPLICINRSFSNIGGHFFLLNT